VRSFLCRFIMKAEEFVNKQKEKYGNFGIVYPPSTDKEALAALTEHFLGKDWCTANPVNSEQVNTEIVALVLEKTQPKKWWERLLNL
jgi:hypothetical protein